MRENIVIIGGGIAGMEAAKQLLSFGLMPVIVEKSDRLGGHVARWHKLFPDMTPAQKLVSALQDSIKDANIFLETEISFINKLKEGFIVMLSNGVSINCRAVLFSTGFQLFPAQKKEEYGYGVYNRVVTNQDLEKWFETRDDERIPSDPKAVGFVHCVGSRDAKAGNTQCSKVCCITAIKQAIEVKELFPEAEVYCFYMDLRLFGKKYEDFYIKAQKDYGIHFIRGRVSEVGEAIDGRVVVKAEDTLAGKPIKVSLDFLVLMSGIIGNKSVNSSISSISGQVDSDGFLRSKDNLLNIVESGVKGVFYAGACTGAKTIPETIAEARSAAIEINNYLQNEF